MKGYIWAFILLFAAMVFQSNFSQYITLWGGHCNLVLICVILFSIPNPPLFGAFFGFVGGLMEGAYIGLSLGSYIVTRLISGLAASSMTGILFSDTPIIPVIATMVLTVISEGAFIIANPQPFMNEAFMKVLGEAVINGAIALICYTIYLHIAAGKRR